MVVVATLLILLGFVVASLGFKLFRILLPIVGFVAGLSVGFGGFQGVFGTGFVSTTLAVVLAVIVGAVLAILAFAFFEIALVVIAAIVGASALSFLAIALGLDKDGFLVFMLSLAGAVIAAYAAVRYRVAGPFIVVLTSAAGVAWILGGILLIVGNVSLDDLNQSGVIPTVVNTVDQSFIWFLVWVGGTLLAMQLQTRLIMEELGTDVYQYKPKKAK